MAKTLLERFVAQLNANVFLAEFAFDSAQIRVPGTGDIEIADHLVLLDDIGIVFQLKERMDGADSSVESLRSWFADSVRKKGVGQIQATREMLSRFAGVELVNQRGHRVPLRSSKPESHPGVIVFHAPDTSGFIPPKYCVSKRAGFVHFIAGSDYFGVCGFLATPTEISDYLVFRERAVRSLDLAPRPVSEAALVGQYMGGDLQAIPNERFAGALDALMADKESWDISFLTRHLGEQVTFRKGTKSDTSHYRILAELAKLSRSELRTLKDRLRRSTDAVRDDEAVKPYRFLVPRTDCGFVLVPLPRALHSKTMVLLETFTRASKHDYGVTKHVGFAIKKEGPYLDLVCAFAEGPNAPNPELDAALAADPPFRRTISEMQPRYNFDSDKLRDAIGPL
jgi:hypothetical protein